MTILRIIGAKSDDECRALHEAMTIWSAGGRCSEALLKRFPTDRVEIHVVSDENRQGAIIVIDGGILGFHPLDEPAETTVH